MTNNNYAVYSRSPDNVFLMLMVAPDEISAMSAVEAASAATQHILHFYVWLPSSAEGYKAPECDPDEKMMPNRLEVVMAPRPVGGIANEVSVINQISREALQHYRPAADVLMGVWDCSFRPLYDWADELLAHRDMDYHRCYMQPNDGQYKEGGPFTCPFLPARDVRHRTWFLPPVEYMQQSLASLTTLASSNFAYVVSSVINMPTGTL